MKNKLIFILLIFLLFGVNCLAQDEGVKKYTIKEYLQDVLPPQEGRRIVLDEITGLLTVTDTSSNHELIKQYISLWDIGPAQVEIEARFVEVTVEGLQELGVEWYMERRKGQGRGLYIGAGSGGVPSSSGGSGVDMAGPISSGAMTAGTFADAATTSGLGLRIGKAALSGTDLFSYLKALEETKKANLLSSPKISTISGQTANIQVTNTLPYITAIDREYADLNRDGTVSSSEIIETYKIAERAIGISLEVTPYVTENSDTITLDIHPTVETLVRQVKLITTTDHPTTLGWPVVDTQTTQTTVTIKNGQTIVLGGLIKDTEDVTKRKVPFLADIPLIGNLFKYNYVDRTKKNLIILLTANIINPQTAGQ